MSAHVAAQLAASELRRKTLEEVQAHERRTRELFHQAPGFICILRGPDHVFEFANEAYLRLVGGREVIGKPLREALPDVAMQGFPDILDEVYRSGKPYTGSEAFVQLQHRRGGPLERHFLNFVYQPIADAQGRTTGIFVEGFDVTETKRAQASLLKSGKEYQALLESIDEGFCVIEVLFDAENRPFDYRFLRTNPAYERQGGLSNVLGRSVREMGSERERLWFDNYGKVALSGKPLRFEAKSASLGRWYDLFAFRTGAPEQRRVAVLFRDITERKRAEEHRKLLINELNHRVKNTLATVQSLAMQSLRHAPSVEQGQAAFVARLLALSKAHDVLTRENWAFAGLRKIVAGAVVPFSMPDRASCFEVEGEPLGLQPHAGLTLAMALHELATNALKYGALSTERGRVAIHWRRTPGGEDRRALLRLSWTESGGPPVVPPERRGFGSRLIVQGLEHDLGATVALRFEPAGLVCEIAMPLDKIVAKDDSELPGTTLAGE